MIESRTIFISAATASALSFECFRENLLALLSTRTDSAEARRWSLRNLNLPPATLLLLPAMPKIGD